MANYLVVGASSGIGLQLARILSEEGHQVTGTWFETEVPNNLHGVSWYRWNALDQQNAPDFVPDVLDGLVYCPGSIALSPFHRLKKKQFADDLELQVLGAVDVLQYALPALKKSGKASVLLFSSVAAQTGFPYHAQVAVSKGAIEGLTRALAAEWAPHIRVNALAPSLTRTPLSAKLISSEEKIEANAARHPLKRIGEAEDIAQLAAFLLSDSSGWISGQIMHIDGGISTLRV